MNAIQDKCRPKHQVLILKCYPRTNKGAVDVKPNSSELSYLLFYATSRRSKIQKIGAFLEKKTASDVWRMRIGNVQVTLGILAALVEKSPKDAVLIAPVVLKILDLVLRSGDITMIESSLPTWEAFCDHHDQSSLFADQAYLQQYQSVVQAYAELASTQPLPTKVVDAKPVHNRRRKAGLRAIKSIVASDALDSPSGRQVETILPFILQNLWVSDDALEILLRQAKEDEKEDNTVNMRRRMSASTVKTADNAEDDANPVSFSGTALDADKLAEDEINLAAMHCLRDIYLAPNRPQVHAATNTFIKFAFARASEGHAVVEQSRNSGWAIKLFSFIARWAPVQDRFVILVSAMDNMTKLPIKEENMDQHLTLAAMVGSLLRSDVNLIGLSVMDVLLALIKQMRRIFNLQLNGSSNGSADEKAALEADSETPKRKDLLAQLEGCVGDLATHVYYADQIPDMIQAILGRLKPTRSSSTISTPQAEKNDENGHSSSGDLNESNSQVDTYFSYNMGRVSALRVVKQILLVANPKTKVTGNMDLSRNKVPAHVWEGSHWLLRDPDGAVRKAYVEALITWLDRETSRLDLRAQDEMMVKARYSPTKSSAPHDINASRRAVSNTSANRERPTTGRRSQFLPMLHLSIYDNALQFVDYDSDTVLLHVLLTNLVFKLGVNAARFGIPMVYRLQEDIQDVEVPIHKVRIASLCHGYFWALTEKFECEASVVGRAIQNEVSRRRQKGFWVEGVAIPAPTMLQVAVPGQPGSAPAWTDEELEREELLPFDDRTSLVECIATAYEEAGKVQPLSPPTSPGRPILNPMLSSTISALSLKDGEVEMPSRFREQMLTNFARDEVVAALQSETRAESMNGSRTGTTITTRQRLALNTTGPISNGFLPASPYGSQRNMRPHSSQVTANSDKLGAFSNPRKTSVRSAVTPSQSMSGRGIASVEQLKLVLAGNAPAARFAPMEEDDSGDSMVSYEDSPSELSFNPAQRTETGGSVASRRSSQPGVDGPTGEEADSVPPVPPLPRMHSHSFRKSDSVGDVSVQDYATSPTSTKPPKRGPSRGADSLRGSVRGRGAENAGSMDLQDLLRGIDSRGVEGSLGNLTKPPY